MDDQSKEQIRERASSKWNSWKNTSYGCFSPKSCFCPANLLEIATEVTEIQYRGWSRLSVMWHQLFMTTIPDKMLPQLVMLPSACVVSFLQLPVQHPTLLTKHTRQVHSHMSSTHCFVLIKSILPVEDEQDLLTPAGDKLFTAIFSVSCRKSVCSPGHQPSLTSYCYILAAWPPV